MRELLVIGGIEIGGATLEESWPEILAAVRGLEEQLETLTARNQFLSTEQVRADVLQEQLEAMRVALREIESDTQDSHIALLARRALASRQPEDVGRDAAMLRAGGNDGPPASTPAKRYGPDAGIEFPDDGGEQNQESRSE